MPGYPAGNPSYYVFGSLTDDYLTQDSLGNWMPAGGSRLWQLIGMPGSDAFGGCLRGVGTTHYASAIEESQYELSRNGRGDVQDVIVFLSDGAANTSPTRLPGRDMWYPSPSGHWRNTTTWRDHPCGAGVQAAANA